MNDCITTTKQSTTKPCAYVLGYIVVKTFEMGINNNCLDMDMADLKSHEIR